MVVVAPSQVTTIPFVTTSPPPPLVRGDDAALDAAITRLQTPPPSEPFAALAARPLAATTAPSVAEPAAALALPATAPLPGI